MIHGSFEVLKTFNLVKLSQSVIPTLVFVIVGNIAAMTAGGIQATWFYLVVLFAVENHKTIS